VCLGVWLSVLVLYADQTVIKI